MHVRPIRPDEVAAFAALGGRPEHVADVRDYTERMFAGGAMRPAWCYVAEDGDRLVGRVAAWTLPHREIPLDLVLLDVPWDDQDLTIGVQLLHQTLQTMTTAGAEVIGHVLDSPVMAPQWQYEHERRVALLERVGFRVARETDRFEWVAEKCPPSVPQRLTYRGLDDVGEAAVIDAIQQVSAESLDARDQHEREIDGPEAAACALFGNLRQMDYKPAWWELAYNPTGELIGLVLPTRSPTTATIGYVGVVPAHRGRGYVDDLLARATLTLHTAGATIIRTDTDVGNAPMANAFRRAGWSRFANRREYEVDLADL